MVLNLPPVSTVVSLPSNRHQQYIQLADFGLKRLRDRCEQGWEIGRNFRYTGDGGIDGRVLIADKLYLIQAKRYRSHINLQHIRNFHQAIVREKAPGGFFVHTGKTRRYPWICCRSVAISMLPILFNS